MDDLVMYMIGVVAGFIVASLPFYFLTDRHVQECQEYLIEDNQKYEYKPTGVWIDD